MSEWLGDSPDKDELLGDDVDYGTCEWCGSELDHKFECPNPDCGDDDEDVSPYGPDDSAEPRDEDTDA